MKQVKKKSQRNQKAELEKRSGQQEKKGTKIQSSPTWSNIT